MTTRSNFAGSENAIRQRGDFHRNVWELFGVMRILLLVIAPYGTPAAFAAGSSITQTLTNTGGDLVTVKLSGAGTMSITLVNTNLGPIDQIILQNTDGTSALAIKVKKSASGNGVVNVNAINGNGSLKSLSAKQANIIGAGINFGGAIGKMTIGNLANSAIAIGGTGVPTNTLTLASLTAGTISNSSIQVAGGVGRVTAAQMLSSQLWAGYTPGDSANPMTGGKFVNGGRILSINVKGLKRSSAPAFANSTIAAQSIGTVKLTSMNSGNNSVAFGVLAETAIKSVKVTHPKFTWKPEGAALQALNDFQVSRSPAVIMASNVRVLSQADLSGAVLTNNVLLFPTNTPALQGVQPGEVLVSGAGNGFLVTVLTVTTQGGSLSLQTAPASLTNVFQKLSFNTTFSFVPAKVLYAAPVSPSLPTARQAFHLCACQPTPTRRESRTCRLILACHCRLRWIWLIPTTSRLP